jgi:hypothetical protein
MMISTVDLEQGWSEGVEKCLIHGMSRVHFAQLWECRPIDHLGSPSRQDVSLLSPAGKAVVVVETVRWFQVMFGVLGSLICRR